MDIFAYRNQRYAKMVTKVINQLENKRLQSLVKIHYYPKLKEFSFNRGVYPDNLLNGSLIGPGFPNQLIQNDTNLFAVLDDLWGEQQRHSIVYNYYYISNVLKYLYLSSKINTTNVKTTKVFFSTQLYHQHRSDSKSKISQHKEFYYTVPYLDFF